MEIVRENLYAVQALYFAWQLEQMRTFEVVDRIAALYRQGLLPLGPGSAGETLRRRTASVTERLAERERAVLYARALGVPGGDADEAEPNREFESLWLRFLASVALHARDDPARVQGAAWTLAANASVHGAGLGAAVGRLATDVDDMMSVLCAPEVAQAYGVGDLWQVIDQVNTQEFGGAVNTIRYRTRAQAGSAVLEWLADHADEPAGMTPDTDLAQASNQWLAVSGAQGAADGTNAQPVESPALVGSPIDMPAIAQDLLRDSGLSSNGAGRDACVLLCGPHGTGKTLAAHVIAEALSLDLFRIDLAAVSSKFIAETERRLDTIFAAADHAPFALLFDEADALLGQRTKIQGTDDRYAKDETGFLARQIESHTGLVLLTMNRCTDNSDALLAERLRKRHFRTIRFPRSRMAIRSR
jgi:hypothetical protein